MSIVCDEAKNCTMDLKKEGDTTLPDDLVRLDLSRESSPDLSIYETPQSSGHTYRRKKIKGKIRKKSIIHKKKPKPTGRTKKAVSKKRKVPKAKSGKKKRVVKRPNKLKKKR